jgi:hypothetical protein
LLYTKILLEDLIMKTLAPSESTTIGDNARGKGWQPDGLTSDGAMQLEQGIPHGSDNFDWP